MLNFNLAGYFNLVVRDGETLEVTRQTGFFKNLITDYGLNRLGTDSILGGACVGTGTAPPQASDIALQSRIATTGQTINEDLIVGPNAEPYYSGRVRTWRFQTGVAAGNLTEVGVMAINSEPFPLWSRSLILDTSGNPVSITVLPTEILDVVYELRLYAMENDTGGGPITLFDTEYNWTMRSINVRQNASSIFDHGFTGAGASSLYWQAKNGDMVPKTTEKPSGADSANSNVLGVEPYINNSLKRTFLLDFPISTGGSGLGIKTIWGQIAPNSSPAFQIGFDKVFPKNGTNSLALKFEVSWARKVI